MNDSRQPTQDRFVQRPHGQRCVLPQLAQLQYQQHQQCEQPQQYQEDRNHQQQGQQQQQHHQQQLLRQQKQRMQQQSYQCQHHHQHHQQQQQQCQQQHLVQQAPANSSLSHSDRLLVQPDTSYCQQRPGALELHSEACLQQRISHSLPPEASGSQFCQGQHQLLQYAMQQADREHKQYQSSLHKSSGAEKPVLYALEDVEYLAASFGNEKEEEEEESGEEQRSKLSHKRCIFSEEKNMLIQQQQSIYLSRQCEEDDTISCPTTPGIALTRNAAWGSARVTKKEYTTQASQSMMVLNPTLETAAGSSATCVSTAGPVLTLPASRHSSKARTGGIVEVAAGVVTPVESLSERLRKTEAIRTKKDTQALQGLCRKQVTFAKQTVPEAAPATAGSVALSNACSAPIRRDICTSYSGDTIEKDSYTYSAATSRRDRQTYLAYAGAAGRSPITSIRRATASKNTIAAASRVKPRRLLAISKGHPQQPPLSIECWAAEKSTAAAQREKEEKEEKEKGEEEEEEEEEEVNLSPACYGASLLPSYGSRKEISSLVAAAADKLSLIPCRQSAALPVETQRERLPPEESAAPLCMQPAAAIRSPQVASPLQKLSEYISLAPPAFSGDLLKTANGLLRALAVGKVLSLYNLPLPRDAEEFLYPFPSSSFSTDWSHTDSSYTSNSHSWCNYGSSSSCGSSSYKNNNDGSSRSISEEMSVHKEEAVSTWSKLSQPYKAEQNFSPTLLLLPRPLQPLHPAGQNNSSNSSASVPTKASNNNASASLYSELNVNSDSSSSQPSLSLIVQQLCSISDQLLQMYTSLQFTARRLRQGDIQRLAQLRAFDELVATFSWSYMNNNNSCVSVSASTSSNSKKKQRMCALPYMMDTCNNTPGNVHHTRMHNDNNIQQICNSISEKNMCLRVPILKQVQCSDTEGLTTYCMQPSLPSLCPQTPAAATELANVYTATCTGGTGKESVCHWIEILFQCQPPTGVAATSPAKFDMAAVVPHHPAASSLATSCIDSSLKESLRRARAATSGVGTPDTATGRAAAAGVARVGATAGGATTIAVATPHPPEAGVLTPGAATTNTGTPGIAPPDVETVNAALRGPPSASITLPIADTAAVDAAAVDAAPADAATLRATRASGTTPHVTEGVEKKKNVLLGNKVTLFEWLCISQATTEAEYQQYIKAIRSYKPARTLHPPSPQQQQQVDVERRQQHSAVDPHQQQQQCSTKPQHQQLNEEAGRTREQQQHTQMQHLEGEDHKHVSDGDLRDAAVQHLKYVRFALYAPAAQSSSAEECSNNPRVHQTSSTADRDNRRESTSAYVHAAPCG